MFGTLPLHSFNSSTNSVENFSTGRKGPNRTSRKPSRKHYPGNEGHGDNKMKEASGPQRLMIPKVKGKVDEILGTLFECDPSLFGFEPSTRPIERELPKFLIQQVPILKPIPFQQDTWDYENQKKMYELEVSIKDVTELWETLKKMREVERSVMEEKGLVDKADHAKDLAEAIAFRGTCQDMCPIYERARRSVENNVVRYEKANPNDKRISRDRALKVFARPAAAAAPPLPSDVRPPHILTKTLDYVVENIVPLLPDCESFLWDRMRSIRQDFTYQNYSGPEAIDCNERIVRIHLLILHQMAKSDLEFSVQQELEQLHKSLITLSEIYDEVRAHGGQCPNEAEFRAYSLLSKMRDPEYDKMVQDLPSHIFHDNLVQLAITFRRLLANSHYIERGVLVTENCMNLYDRFFQLIQSEKVPFLMGSFLEVYLNDIRFYAFKSLSLAVTRKGGNLPCEYFMEHLLFRDHKDFSSFCSHYSIDMEDGKVILKSLTATSHLLSETRPLKKNWLKCVDDKLAMSDPVSIINTGKLNTDSIPSSSEVILSGISEVQNFPSSGNVDKASETVDYHAAINSTVAVKNLKGSHQPLSTFSIPKSSEDQFTPVDSNISFAFEKDAKNHEPNIKKTISINENGADDKQPTSTVEFRKKLLEQKRLRKQYEDKQSSFAPSKEAVEKEQKTSFSEQQELELKRKVEMGKNIIIEKEKELQKVRKVDRLSLSILEELLKDKVMRIVKETTEKKERREKHINSLATGLLTSFIHEQIFFIFQDLICDRQMVKNIVKKCFLLWKRRYLRSKADQEKQRRLEEESKQLKSNLGVGNRVTVLNRACSEAKQSFSVSNNSSFIKSSVNNYATPLAMEENHFTTPIRMKNKVWTQLNLKSIYCNTIRNRYEQNFDSSLDNLQEVLDLETVLYSKNWNSISASWLLNKFGLVDVPRRNIREGLLEFGFTKLYDGYKAEEFNNVSLVVFNTGVTDTDIFDLDMKLLQDGEKLIELICGIAFNTNFKFTLLLVYWESVENPKPRTEIENLLKIPKIMKRFGNLIQKIATVKIVGDDPEGRLANGLRKVADNFTFEMTERGIYNERRKRNTIETNQISLKEGGKHDVAFSIDEKMQRMLESEQAKEASHDRNKSAYEHLRRHILASPRSKNRKLPVLLSDSHTSKYKTPLLLSKNARTLSNGSTISNPSHLAKKMRLPRHLSSHSERGSIYGTPIQPRNLINHRSVLSTPVLADMNPSQPSGSPVENLTMGSEFESFSDEPFTQYLPKEMNQEQPSFKNKKFEETSSGQEPKSTKKNDLKTSSEPALSESIMELKDLIASVKRTLNNSNQ